MNAISTRMGTLMAADIHELHRAMGAVEANTQTIMTDMAEVKKDIREVVPTVREMKAYIDAEVKPEIDGLKRSRWLRHGITIGLGTASGIGGSVVAKIPALATFLHIP